MDHEALTQEFDIRFYRWRLLEAHRECQAEFPFLSKMHSRYIRINLEAIQTFCKEEQLKLLPAIVKLANKKMLHIMGDQITKEEEILLIRLKAIESKLLRSSKVNIQENKLKKIGKGKLKNFIQEALLQVFDVNFLPCASGFYFVNRAENFTTKTFLEIGGGYYYYSHQIYINDQIDSNTLRLGPPTINLSSWLGLNSRPWCFFEESDAPLAARAITQLCKQFISNSTELLSGLSLG
jgi:hypothetical protein